MSFKRPLVLVGISWVLTMGLVTHAWGEVSGQVASTREVQQPPLPGKNAISDLKVRKDDKGLWMASFDYFYTGAPTGVSFFVDLSQGVVKVGELASPRPLSGFGRVERGQHHVDIEIPRPARAEALTTSQVTVRLEVKREVLAVQQVMQDIEWPDAQTWAFEMDMARQSPDELFKEAVAMIDAGGSGSLAYAKRVLERLISRNAQFDASYVELARVAMKTNWGPEGLHQAENLLKSAQQISPDSVNAKILLGYVYAHQGRYAKAETLFMEVAPGNPKNLWLWSNWGELLVMQGQAEAAIQKYREALARPRAFDTYDRARLDAYEKLLALLEPRKDFDGIEAVHKQRVREYGKGSCYGAQYAKFMLIQRGDASTAVELARQAVEGSCNQPMARETLGVAHYAAWSGASGPQRDKLLNQARVFMPAGPQVLYLLATSDHTIKAARQLVAAGEPVDQHDNEKFNALAYAFQRSDLAAARRLLKLGARADALVGDADMPVSLLPVFLSDTDGIHLMQEFGVDYTKVRYQGGTAIDMAKRTGGRKLLRALNPKAGVL